MYFYAQKTELILSSSLNYDALSSSESSARDPEKSQVNNAVKKPTDVSNASHACDGITKNLWVEGTVTWWRTDEMRVEVGYRDVPNGKA